MQSQFTPASSVESLEYLSASIATLCGVWFLLPYDTLHSAITYSAMQELAKPFHPYEEAVWAVLSLAEGAFQLWAIQKNCPRWRRLALLFAASYFGGMTVMFLQSNPASLFGVPFACFAIALMYAYHKVV